jgi:hypothetical protein
VAQMVSFISPGEVALVPCDPAPLVPGSGGVRTSHSGRFPGVPGVA